MPLLSVVSRPRITLHCQTEIGGAFAEFCFLFSGKFANAAYKKPIISPHIRPPIWAELSIPPNKPSNKFIAINGKLIKSIPFFSLTFTLLAIISAVKTPYNPKMAPEAPTPTEAGCHHILTMLEAMPQAK